jgi:hypothetical protein
MNPTPASASDRRVALLVAALSLALFALGAPLGVPFSAGVAGALEILEGGWPYRDFWTIYAPGHFFLLAGLFALFGRELLVAALAAAAFGAAACALLFLALRRLHVKRGVAALAALAFAGVLFRTAPTLCSYAPALACGLAGIERTLAAAAAPARRPALAAGAWFGAAAWFKHDVAAYLFASALAAIAAPALLRRRRAQPGALLPLVLGAAGALLPMAALVAATGGREAWRDLFLFPLTGFAAARPEKYPTLIDSWQAARGDLARASAALQWVRHWAPAWTWIALLVLAWRRRSHLLSERLAAAALASVALPLFFAAAQVQTNTHILSMSGLVLGTVAVAWWDQGAGRARGLGAAARAAATLLLLAALADEPARSAAKALDLARRGRTIDAPGAAFILVAPREAEEIEGAARRVRELCAPGEPIYVGVARHDAVVISRPELYLLLDRPNATRYGELHPAIVDREEAQREIAADLDRKGVRVVVLWHVGWPAARFDEIRARRGEVLPGTGSTFLDSWLSLRFESAGRFGELEILVRRRPA